MANCKFLLFFSLAFFSTETVTKIYPSASVFDTSAHEVQATTTVVSELAPSVKKPHSHTTASGYVLSSIRQLVPNTGKCYNAIHSFTYLLHKRINNTVHSCK